MDCLFCKMINNEIESKKIYEDDYVVALLDLYPSADCHTLIIPKKHITDMFELDNDTLSHINDALKKITPTIINKLGAESCSLRVNYGTSQAIKHYHLHILPNYDIKKPTVSQASAYELLKDSFK